jgi:hypothetical protein
MSRQATYDATTHGGLRCGITVGRAVGAPHYRKEISMGRSLLLWLLGVPIPIIILLAIFWR